MARFVGDQLQQHEPQFAAVEHSLAPAAAVVVMSVAPAESAAAETMSAAVHPVAHRFAHHVVHGVALAAAVPVHSPSVYSMSHLELLHMIRCV